MDEPFANLDQALREKYRVNLKVLLKQFHITTVYVTHDHHEALVLADLMAVMDRGRIEQVGTPQELYDQPKNVFVAGFLNLHMGSPPISLIDARYMPQGQRLENVWVGVRPEHVAISREHRDDTLAGIIASTLSLPSHNTTLLTIRVGEHEVHARTSGHDKSHLTGSQVWLTFRQYHLFDKESGMRRGTGGDHHVHAPDAWD